MTDFKLHPNAVDLLSLWLEARGDSPLPDRSFIDPIKLRRWVGDIAIVALHDGPKRFFVSLQGASAARHVGESFHKHYLEDVIPEASHARALEPYRDCMKSGQPTYSIQRLSRGEEVVRTYERMVMPCCKGAADVVERFLVWIPPIQADNDTSLQIYERFDPSAISYIGREKPVVTSEVIPLCDVHPAMI